jgi:hypothetical protein
MGTQVKKLTLIVAIAVLPLGAHAQVYTPRPPGSTANSTDRPAADTPIPSHFQESYKVYLKMKADAKGGTEYTKATYGKMPDWSGLWSRAGGLNFSNVPAELTPRYQAAYEEKLRMVRAGNEWDSLSDCLPAGYPRWLTEPFLREFIITPNQTWLINEMQSDVRRIYTDGRGHTPEDDAQLSWTGDSIGFWDDQTLVVHTIRVKYGQYQRSQPDYSNQTSTVERIRMTGPNTIENEVTVWDPKGLKKPWQAVFRFNRNTTPGAHIDMWSCSENNNVVRTPTGGSQFILKGEKGYKDPATFWLTDAQKKLFAEDEAEEKK